MDPITHAVVGLSIAVLAGEPLTVTNPAILGCVAGAIIPDGDIIMQLKGDYVYLKNHRGMSHSIPMMFIYSGVLTGLLWLAFGNIALWKVFTVTLLGCFSHIALDITNSYGAQILWPLNKKRITLDLLLIYDPMLIIVCLSIILPYTRNIMPYYMAVPVFIGYLIFRHLMKKLAQSIVLKNLGGKYKPVHFRILPSMIGLIKWHFILSTGKEKVIGEVNIFPRRFKVIDIKKNIDTSLYKLAIDTPVARFFSQFTPIFHIDCERIEDSYIFKFIDLRYYLAKDFLHHATAVINRDLEVVTSLFHPYTKSRNVEV
ncbi:MAG TPA: metal-dependent hydrolase [Clostridia bacterium]|nr:metal-dependent hydrolase [Clostridia bacterium]